MIRVIVNGCCGRMGQRIASLVHADPDMEIAGGLEFDGHPDIGKNLSEVSGLGELGVRISTSIETEADVLIDFSAPDSTARRATECAGKGIAFLAGTTGLEDHHKAEIAAAAEKIPVLVSPNMSIGVNLLFKLTEQVARILGDSCDIEIIETHHNEKKDAPSGTAVRLAEHVAKALEKKYPEDAIHGRVGQIGERPKKEIGVHAVRGGDIVGDHSVLFAGQGERLELVHRSQSRDTFASGAVRAAKFIAGKTAGSYSILDVLEGDI